MSETDIALTSDGALTLRVTDTVRDKADAWIPRYRRDITALDDSEFPNSDQAVLSVQPTDASVPDANVPDLEPPTLTLANVRAHVLANRLRLRSPSGIVGDIDLVARRGAVCVAPTASTYEVQGALTLASAMLLGRIGRALIHAAALVDPQGRGWLLVGDSHAGKTTTCATLITAGWRFVADDQVVVACSDRGIVVEGWPREAHLDAGWHTKEVARRRIPADLRALRADAWTSHATLHGVVFPVVAADQPTCVDRISSVDALTRIVRQSPWVFADVAVAPTTLALLTRIASLECASLVLGRDSYANGDVLAAHFSAIQ